MENFQWALLPSFILSAIFLHSELDPESFGSWFELSVDSAFQNVGIQFHFYTNNIFFEVKNWFFSELLYILIKGFF